MLLSSWQPKHIRASHLSLGNTNNLNDRLIRTYVQVSTFIQSNPADGLGLDVGQFYPEVLFYGIHQSLIVSLPPMAGKAACSAFE